MEHPSVHPMRYFNWKTQHDHFRKDVLAGLAGDVKSVPPKYFYDEHGSQLFDRICESEEYYPTRTESKILSLYAQDILAILPDEIALIELGSGSSIKTRYLLEQGRKNQIVAYVPIDIAEEHLLNSTAELSSLFESIAMIPICADYTCLDALPRDPLLQRAEPLLFFPGSTIGNLEREAAGELIDSLYRMIHGCGYLLVGIDLIKDKSILEAAYNDRQGYTAAFNINLLERINSELGGDFDLSSFTHKAFYNEKKQRIEMHLVSSKEQSVRIDDQTFHFQREETIHTESSHKYLIHEFDNFMEAHGFLPVAHWTDAKQDFAVVLLKASRYPQLH